MVPLGEYVKKNSSKEKFLISVTKHKEIKITVRITNEDNNIMLLNSFSSISKAILRVINTPVDWENISLFYY